MSEAERASDKLNDAIINAREDAVIARLRAILQETDGHE